MTIVAVLEVFGTVLSVVNGLVELYDTVTYEPDLTNSSVYHSLSRAVRLSTARVLNACASIYSALTQLAETEFRSDIQDTLGDMDAAEQALSNWLTTQNENQRSDALTLSAGALADLLRFSTGAVYPNASLVLPIMEALLRRLMILKAAYPGFGDSEVALQPLNDSILIMRKTADEFENQILDANVIREHLATQSQVYIDPESGDKIRETITTVTVSYSNVTATSAFSKTFTFDGGPGGQEVQDSLADFRAEASVVRSTGLPKDFEQAQIANIRKAADRAEGML